MIDRYYMAQDASSTPPAAGFTRTLILSTLSNFGNHCNLSPETVYTASNAATISPTMPLFFDDALTTPVLGYSYVSDPVVGTIYNLNDLTGVVGSNTGQSC
jgi:hypothetical protein